jgi:hypothetical protein
MDRLRIAPNENWYRDVVLFFVSLFVIIAVTKTSDVIHQQRHDRSATASAICGAMNAVIHAGRATITGGAGGVSGEFERNLRKLGYPPRKVRQAQARKAADLYAASIAQGVAANTTGVSLRGLVRSDGTLDCQRLPLVRSDH